MVKTSLRARIEEHKGEQQALATELGISKSLLSHLKAGRRNPTIRVLTAAAKYWNCTVDELLRPAPQSNTAKSRKHRVVTR